MTLQKKLSKGDTHQALIELQQVEQIPIIQTDKNLLSYVNVLMARGYQQVGQSSKTIEKLHTATQYFLETNTTVVD